MVSGTNRTAAGTACTGLSPPAVLADRPHCLRRLTVRQDRFTLGLWLDECIFNPDVQIIATGPPRPAVRQRTAPPFSSFLSGIMACSFRTAFPFRAAHQTYPVDLFSFSAVASSHERIECNAPMPTGADTESCLKLRRLFQSPTTSGKAAGCRLFPFASVTEICCQHINELRIGWWLHQRDAHDKVQKTVVRIPPACLNHCPQIAFHAVA